ncbi:DUF7919 family protein [Streptomyces sp. NPDC000851]
MSSPQPTGAKSRAGNLQRMTQTHRAQQTRGCHFCPWCASRLFGPRGDCPRGSAEIRVMGNSVAYAALELVAHYADEVLELGAQLPTPPGRRGISGPSHPLPCPIC